MMASKHISLNQKPQIELFLNNLYLDHEYMGLTADSSLTFEHSLWLSDHEHKCVDITLVPSNHFKKHLLHCVTFIAKVG